MTKTIYLDNGATAKVDPEVFKKMRPYFDQKYGNANSLHQIGRESREGIEKARNIIAKSINAKPREIIFTSGGTESNNLAIKGVAFANKEKGNHIITSKVEHKCILDSCKWLEKQGFEITYLDVDAEGFVNPDDLRAAITDQTILVSILHGNNEIGTISDMEKFGEICKERDVYFHTDACQSYTKTDLDVEKFNLSLITLNSHKLHGPKGVGALYIKMGTEIDVWQHGGGQEFGMRSGTENVHGIVGFGKAVEIGMDKNHRKYMSELRDKLISGIEKIPDVKLNGPRGDKRLCNNVNFSFKSIEGEALGGYLDQKFISSSTGSACSEKTLEPSYVLMAIGLNHEDANGSLRLSLGRDTTEEEINEVLDVLPKIVEKLRRMSPLVKVANYVLKKSI